MKRLSRWVYPILFLCLCAIVVWFLRLFTQVDQTMLYIDWESSTRIEQDGSQHPFSWDSYSNTDNPEGTYCFTAQLPQGISSGYLLFETSGLSLSLSLNGEEIYQSSVYPPETTLSMSQATIPLPEGASGELVMNCEVLDSGAMFPPLIRYMPDGLQDTETFAIANHIGFSTGASALILLLAAGLFLSGIMLGKPDWSLIPLILASVGMVVYRIAQGEGYYFLPLWAVELLSRPEIGISTAIALMVYLAMNRKRGFWKYIGLFAAWSGGALLICYLASLARGGYLSLYINESFLNLLQYGIYDGLLYWFTLWLTMVCTLVSAYVAVRAFADQNTEAQNLALKNKMILESFHQIEENMKESSAFRHELNHQLTALECLYQKGDYPGIKVLLDQWKQQLDDQAQTILTKNLVVNTILQEISQKASQRHIAFDVQVALPKDLPIAEQDLCSFLMNMLENALEACQKVEPAGRRFIRFRARTFHGLLAIQCENSFIGEIRKDAKGRLLTTKEDVAAHGYGLRQMAKIAEKYHSQLDIQYSTEGSFLVRAALKLPETKEPSLT